MIILCILTAITALITLILSLWVRLRVAYTEENGLRVWVRVLFLKFNLLPAKQQKINLRDYKIKRFRKLERKRTLLAEKERHKKAKKSAESDAAPAEISPELPLGEKIALLTKVITKIIRRFARYLRVDVSRLYIKVASDDAAKTAYLYAAAVQSAAYLTEIMQNITNFNVNRSADFSVIPDFTSEQSEINADFTFRMRVMDMARLGISALIGYMRVKSVDN